MRKGPAISSFAWRVICKARCRRGKSGLRCLEELPPLVSQRDAARRAMEEANAQVLFQLRQRLTRGLRGHALGSGSPRRLPKLGSLHKGGHRPQLVDRHGAVRE